MHRLSAKAVPDSGISLARERHGIDGTQFERLRDLRRQEAAEKARAEEAGKCAALLKAAADALENPREVVVGVVNISQRPAVLLERMDDIVPIITVRDIQRAVCARFRMSLAELVGQQRTAVIALRRQMAMYLCKKMTARSLPDIGRRFGGKDHTTVFHAVRKIEKLVTTDEEVAREIEYLTDCIYRGVAR